jgi:hypothetical protein
MTSNGGGDDAKRTYRWLIGDRAPCDDAYNLLGRWNRGADLKEELCPIPAKGSRVGSRSGRMSE